MIRRTGEWRSIPEAAFLAVVRRLVSTREWCWPVDTCGDGGGSPGKEAATLLSEELERGQPVTESRTVVRCGRPLIRSGAVVGARRDIVG
jgi:hypothetical protein